MGELFCSIIRHSGYSGYCMDSPSVPIQYIRTCMMLHIVYLYNHIIIIIK